MEDIFKEESANPNAISILLGDITKSGIGEVVNQIVQSVDDGIEDGLEIYIKAKAIEEFSKGLVEQTKSYAIQEARLFDKSESKKMGCVFNIKNLPDNLSYDHDPNWVKLNKSFTDAKANKDDYEANMKHAMKNGSFTTEDGLKVLPAVVSTHGGESIEVRIPK